MLNSNPNSSSPPSVEGKKGRVQRPPAGGEEMLEKQQMEELKTENKRLKRKNKGLKRVNKGLKRKIKEHEALVKELKNQTEEQGKVMKKLKKRRKELKNKPTTTSNCLSFGNPSPPRSVQEGNTRKLKLHIEMKVAKRVYTCNKLAGDPRKRIRISLIDVETGQTITTGLESSIKVCVVVLDGKFNREDHENWSPEEFARCIIEGREHKGQLLRGDRQLTLKEGVGFINNLKFTDNSSWNPDKFRIGVHVDSRYYDGTRIREAFTEPFVVLEHRGETYKKHYPPAASDEVWRLDGIRKDGAFHNRLMEKRIYNVQEFLQAYNRDQKALKLILGGTMNATMWSTLLDHAQTCPPNEKWLVYYYDNERNYAPLFDNFARLTGFIWNGIPRPIDSLSDSQKRSADWLVELALQNWKDVTEYPDILPHHEAVAVAPGNHDSILVGPSISQNHPTQISIQDHPGSSAFQSQGLSSRPDAMTNSGMAAEQTSSSQQGFQASENLMATGTTSSYNHYNDCISLDEFH